jgi:hypothetical protein
MEAPQSSQNVVAGDEVDRAVARNGVRPGSTLELDVRKNIFLITGAGPIGRAEKLDEFIASQKGDPAYADSFVAPNRPKERVPPRRDVLTPDREEFSAIAAGKSIVHG